MTPTSFPVQPSRINDTYVRGTIYHFDRISEADLRKLGILLLPSNKPGSTLRSDGITVRRLRCGNLNAAIESTSSLLVDKGLDRFMQVLRDPREHGDAQTLPARLQVSLEDETWVPDGEIDIDIITREIRASVEANGAYQSICAGHSGTNNFEGHLNLVHPEDRTKVRSAMSRLLEWYEPTELEYRYGIGAVRIRSVILKNQNGFPVLARVSMCTFKWGASQARSQFSNTLA